MNTTVGRGLADRISEAQDLLRRDPQRSLQLVEDVEIETVSPEEALGVLSIRSRANIHLGRYDQGEPNAQAAIKLAQVHGMRVQEGLARNEAGVFRFVRGEFDDALNHYAAAEQLLRDADEAGRARVFVNIANVYNLRGDYLQSLMAYEQALTIAQELNDLLTQAKIYSNMAGLYRTTLGSSEVAADYLAEATRLYTELDDHVGLAKCLVNQANHHIVNRQYAEAEACYRRSLQIREAFSEPDDHIMTYDGLVSSLLRQQKIDEAREALETARTVLGQSSLGNRAEQFMRLAEARVLAADGRIAECIAIAEEVYTFMKEYGQSDFAAELQQMIAESYFALGRHEEAASLFRGLIDDREQEARRQASHRMEMIRAQLQMLRDGAKASVEDIRQFELIPTRERLTQAEATNEEFVAVLAHELKSPLHTMRSVMSLLANADAVSKDERQEYGRAMLELSTRLIDQITTTLSAAKQRHESSASVVNARTVWEYVLQGIQMGTADGSQRVSWTFDQEDYSVAADESMLVTIMENLVSNALKFSGPESRVTVTVSIPSTTDDTRRLLLEVVDEGPGLSKDDLASMYRPFQTLSARPTGDAGSTGLGLFLVRRTVEALHGRVWAENHPNGAIFHVELPLSPETPA